MTELSARQRDVARLVAARYTDKQIVAELGISQQRVSRIIWQIAKRWELDQYRDLRVQIAQRADAVVNHTHAAMANRAHS